MSSEELIREANDPATAPARLAELASADRATWPALAGNPSTYDALLSWLGERNDPGVNAALAARAQAALPPVPPAPAAPPAAADPAPTVVSPAAPVAPAAPSFEAPAQAEAAAPEQTAVFAAPVAEPTAVFQTPASPEPTATYPAAPATTETPAAPADGNNGGKNLAIVIAMVAVVIALIAGAAYGATQLFGDDDDPVSSSTNDTKKTDDAPSDDDLDADEDIPSTPPSLDSDDDDLSGSSDEFCSTMKSVQEASQDLVSRSSSSPDLDDLKEMGEDMAKAYDDLADSAPADLRPDIEAMGGYFELMTNPTADGASKMSESFSDYMDSAQKVSTYYAQNCF